MSDPKSSRVIFILAFILFPGFAGAQDLAFVRKIIDTLCSPYMAGRGYLDEGDLKAASFIAEEFKNNELQRFHNSYFHNFNVSVNTFPGKMTLLAGGKHLTPGEDFIMKACSPGISGSFNVFQLKRSWLNSPGRLEQNLKKNPEKLMLIDESGLALTPKEIEALTEQLDADPAGIAGILVVTGKLTASVSPFVCRLPVIYLKKNAIEPVKKFARGKLPLATDIEHEFLSNYETQNVIGFIPGTKKRDSLIVLTAHYDHLGKMGNETYFPGANDNASGIAMLLSLVRHFSLEPPAYTIIFIAFGAEELYLQGSRRMVETSLFPLEKIAFLINIDLAGTGDDGVTAVNGTVFTDQFSSLDSINSAHGWLPKVNARAEACNSDHCFFYRNGVPCFFIYTLGGIQAYHDIYDRPETLPLTEFEDYFRLLTAFTRHLMK